MFGPYRRQYEGINTKTSHVYRRPMATLVNAYENIIVDVDRVGRGRGFIKSKK